MRNELVSNEEAEQNTPNKNSRVSDSVPSPTPVASAFQAVVLDQLAKIQEQNEFLKTRVVQLEQEQEDFYIETCKKLEVGLKQFEKCATDVGALKEIFKEVVGVMSEKRVLSWDHSNEHVTGQEAEDLVGSHLLHENHEAYRQQRDNEHRLEAAHAGGGTGWCKTEESDMWTRLNYQDFEPPSSLVERSQSVSDAYKDDRSRYPCYKLNRSLRTVYEVAQEYFAGLRGQPSLLALERRFGPSWRRKPSERTFYAKRMHIINKIIDIKNHPEKYNLPAGTTRLQATSVVENIRLKNNSFPGKGRELSLNQLYIYFAKKMDRPSDYSLTLQTAPRRHVEGRSSDVRHQQSTPLSNGSGEEDSEDPNVDSHHEGSDQEA
ncbi:Transcription factor-like protein EUC1 [Lachancea thermotolerans]